MFIVAPARFDAARLYFVTDAGTDDRVLAEALAGGVDVLQLREKEAADEDIVRAGARFRSHCDDHGALFVVNDRVDLALAAGADGVHVGQDDDAVEEVRERCGDGLAIGLSTHSPEQLSAGLATSADYVCVGPVFATPTKPDYAAVGLDLVRRAAATADRPWFAIGGIDETNAPAVVAAGARRLVVVRAIRDARDPRAAAGALRAALEGSRAGVQ